MIFDRLRIDDPVGATSVHLVCGVLGTILTGVFGKASLGMARDGLLYGGGFDQLGVQLLGIGMVGVFVTVASTLVWLGIRQVFGLRVTEEEEVLGLDLAEMGMEAYPNSN